MFKLIEKLAQKIWLTIKSNHIFILLLVAIFLTFLYFVPL